MNDKIFESYKKQIEKFEKLSFDEAKEMLRNSLSKDEENKKQIIEKVFKGTLHHVLRHIKICKYTLLKSYSYDLNDVFSVCFNLWYEKIKNYTILEIEDVARALGVTFSNEVVKGLIPSEQEYEYLSLATNREYFNNIALIYFSLRNKNVDVKFNEVLNIYKESLGYYHFLHWYEPFENAQLRWHMMILEKCYLILSNNDKEDVELNKLTLQKLSKLIEEMGLFESLNNNYPVKNDFEDEIIENLKYEEINDTVFNTDILSDREKEVIARRFGLLGYKPHSLEQAGVAFGVTRERVRQMEAKAIRKLRGHRTKHLKEYVR